MWKELTDPRERLIYAFALLMGVQGGTAHQTDLLAEAMEIIEDVVQNTWITVKAKEASKYE